MHMVNRDSSVEAEDIFNNMHRVIITNVDNDMWEQINQVNLPAHNVNPGAPEHLSMVNNLLQDNANNKRMQQGTNLENISQPQWRNLQQHVLTLARPMTRCCFQCGMLNHPTSNNMASETIEHRLNLTLTPDCMTHP